MFYMLTGAMKQANHKDAKYQAVALVGAGAGGTAVLKMFLQIPGVNIVCVCDINPDAPGIMLARDHGIRVSTDPEFCGLKDNPEVKLILEITGRREVFQKLDEIKHTETSLIGAEGNRFIFELLEAQEEAKSELRAYQETLEERIAERTRDLEITNEELRRINEDKTRYILRSTHQLKAPFAAIESYSDVLLGGFAGRLPDKAVHVVEKIKQRCNMLSGAIREMLELANLKNSGDETGSTEEHSIGEIIKEVAEKQNVVAGKKDIALEFSPTGDGSDRAICNRDQLVECFSILVENAIHYSHEKSAIRMGVLIEGDRIKAFVSDNGIGIEKEHLERIYDEYFRSNRAAAKHRNGTGLGLAIAKHIAELNNMEINVESRVDEGTTFFLTMNRSR